MARTKNRQTYPKEESDTMRETIQKLKSQVRNLQKTVRILKSENNTLLDAWAKTESFLEEVTEGAPLGEVIKYKKLPKKVMRKGQQITEDKEDVRKKWAEWRKENL